jgi:hypothetical protein
MKNVLNSTAWLPSKKKPTPPTPPWHGHPPPKQGVFYKDKVRLLAWFKLHRRAIGLPEWAHPHVACVLARYGHIERVRKTDVWAITRAGEEWLA